MAVVLKTTVPETVPGVRIPLPPPFSEENVDSAVGAGAGQSRRSRDCPLFVRVTFPSSFPPSSAAQRAFPSEASSMYAASRSTPALRSAICRPSNGCDALRGHARPTSSHRERVPGHADSINFGQRDGRHQPSPRPFGRLQAQARRATQTAARFNGRAS